MKKMLNPVLNPEIFDEKDIGMTMVHTRQIAINMIIIL